MIATITLFMRRVVLFVLVLVVSWFTSVFILLPRITLAQEDCNDAKLKGLGVVVVNCSGEEQCTLPKPVSNPGAALPSGAKIYMLGDSLTVGMRDNGQIAEKFSERGWEATKINAISGKRLDWGLEQVGLDADTIKSSSAVIIGLGTNHIGDVVSGDTIIEGGKDRVEDQMQAVIDAVKTHNPTAAIYWTSVFVTGRLQSGSASINLDTAREVLNEALDEVSVRNKITTIPWAESGEAAKLLATDGIHPFGKYSEMADFVIKNLSTSPVTNLPSDCTCSANPLPGKDNAERVFNYFTIEKALPPHIAAGILGNMFWESGVEPMRLQNEFDRLVPASEAVSIAVPGSSLGWGLVQWTPGTKIISTANAAGVPFEEIDTLEFQLDFLWGQLKGEAWRGNPNNESSEKNAGDIILASATVEEAAINFGKEYERFLNSSDLNNPEYLKRIEEAQKYLQTMSTSGGVSRSTSCISNRQAGANGWDLPGEGPNPMVLFSQRSSGSDPAVEEYFGKDLYGPGPIAHCGCGPTSWAMIVSTLTENRVEPPEAADWAAANGFQESGDPCGGSNWWWVDNPGLSEAKWGVTARSITIDEAAESLRNGALIMVSAGPGPFTSGGHLLVMRAVTEDGKFLFADPNDHNDTRSEARVFNGESKNRTPLAAEDFSGSIKGLWEVKAL